jgi:uncharacterized UPF0160 family protein
VPEVSIGLRDERLSKVSGLPEPTFAHARGFIDGDVMLEHALRMAK